MLSYSTPSGVSQQYRSCFRGAEITPRGPKHILASHSSPSMHAQPSLIAATCLDIAGRVLRDPNSVLPLAVTIKVNYHGSRTLLGTDPATPAAAFAPYFDTLFSQFNKSFSIGHSPWLPFRLPPNAVLHAIHSLPIAFVTEDPNDLFPCIPSQSSTTKLFESSPPLL